MYFYVFCTLKVDKYTVVNLGSKPTLLQIHHKVPIWGLRQADACIANAAYLHCIRQCSQAWAYIAVSCRLWYGMQNCCTMLILLSSAGQMAEPCLGTLCWRGRGGMSLLSHGLSGMHWSPKMPKLITSRRRWRQLCHSIGMIPGRHHHTHQRLRGDALNMLWHFTWPELPLLYGLLNTVFASMLSILPDTPFQPVLTTDYDRCHFLLLYRPRLLQHFLVDDKFSSRYVWGEHHACGSWGLQFHQPELH